MRQDGQHGQQVNKAEGAERAICKHASLRTACHAGILRVVRHQSRFDLFLCLLGAFIIVCAALFTFPWVMHPNNPNYLGFDAWALYGPELSFMDHAIHDDHEFPLWNPLYFCGQPYAANPGNFVFYPPNLLRSLLTFHPTPLWTHVGIALMVLAQVLVAGLGALLLARRQGYSRGGALLAAFAFPFSGALVARILCHWIYLNSACWLPWVLLCTNIMIHGRSRSCRIAAAAGAGALYSLCILGGVPILGFVGGVLLGAYWLLETVGKTVLVARDMTGTSIASRWKPVLVSLLASVSLFAVVMIVSAFLAAPLLLPLGEFAPQTSRAGVITFLEDIAPLSYGWQLVKMLVFYEGHPSHEGMRGGGAAVVAFAFLALLLKPRWNGLRWAALFMLVLDFSVSEPLLFGRLTRVAVPFISNDPARCMLVGCLPLAMLAGWGLDAVMQISASRRRRLSISVLVAAVGGAVMAILLLAAPPDGHEAPLLAVVLPAAALATAALGLWLRRPLPTGMIAAMLVLGETLAWNAALPPDRDRVEPVYQDGLVDLAARKNYPQDNRRITDTHPNMRLYDLKFIMNGYDPLHLSATKSAITPVVPGADSKNISRFILAEEPTLQSQRGNLFLKRRFWLAREYCPEPLPDYARLYPATRVVFLPEEHDNSIPVPVVALDQIPETGLSEKKGGANQLPGGGPLAIKREMMPLPDSYTPLFQFAPGGEHASLFLTVAGQGSVELVPIFMDPAAYDGPQFGTRRYADLKANEPQTIEFPMPDAETLNVFLHVSFAESTPEVLITAADVAFDGGDEKDHIQIVSQTANGADLRLKNLPGPRVLLFVDSYFNGWKATVDGRETPILRANDAFKAIIVPAGSCEVRFTYSSKRVIAGLLLAVVGALFVLGTGSAAFLDRKRTACDS